MDFRTDMADERVDEYKKTNNLSDIDGIKVETQNLNSVKVTTVDVLNENGKNAVGKDIGKYITIQIKDVEYLNEKAKEEIIDELAKQINILVGNNLDSIMIVGLGNEYVTPDSLGPKVISFINVTRHVIKYAKELVEDETREISAISPGVMGMTGIETEEIVESIIGYVKPKMLIVIDSLASLSVSRLGKTIQLGNTGITPGAGIGNKRQGLNFENLKIPVIAIGVPTVVDQATITNEAIDIVIKNVENEALNYMNHGIDVNKIKDVFKLFDNTNRYNMIANILQTQNFIVTPKEIDTIIAKISEIIASGINKAI